MNQNESVGKLAIRYNENQLHVANLRSTIGEMASDLSRLARALQQPGLEVISEGEAYALDGASRSIAHSFLSDLPKHLNELKDAVLEQGQLEDCLRQAGLEGLVK